MSSSSNGKTLSPKDTYSRRMLTRIFTKKGAHKNYDKKKLALIQKWTLNHAFTLSLFLTILTLENYEKIK